MNKKLQGKRNRKRGGDFERKVRKDIEDKKWTISRWQNNVEFSPLNETEGRLVPAKSNRFSTRTNGFPDFIIYKMCQANPGWFNVMGVECKSNGYLDKKEKEKCGWLIGKRIFNKIIIAKKGKKRGEIEYDEFEA
jgi:hypothetical protein